LLSTAPVSIDIRLSGGSTSITQVGQVVPFDVFATVTGTDGNPANEGFQEVTGSIVSTNSGGGAALGTIQVSPFGEFTGLGSSNGTQQDLDSDTDLDVGSNTDSDATGFFAVRDGSMAKDGTQSGNSQTFQIGSGTFTVTKLLGTGTTTLTWRVRNSIDGFLYMVDGTNTSGIQNGGSVAVGQGVALTQAPQFASINGRVFNDKNATGVFDGDDTGIDGFRVFLDKNSNGILDSGEVSKPVSSTGTYHFTDVVPGTYRVREVFRDGWRQSFPALGYYEVTLRGGDVAKTQSFANTDRVVIKGNVWMDANHDGAFTPGESSIPQWMVYIDHNNNGVLDKGDDWDITNFKGDYRFTNLAAGKFVIRTVPRDGYRQTAPAGRVHSFTEGAGGSRSNQDFGFKRLT
jgi:hypothetical protein